MSALGAVPLAIADVGGVDWLTGPDTATAWHISGVNAGDLGPAATFDSVENLAGGSDIDVFVFAGGVSVAGAIDGGGGINTLDYSAFTTSVVVNLQAGQAIAAPGGIVNFANVFGGAGDDTLIGNDLDNVLIGKGGNDLLLGLGGSDSLAE